MGITYKAFDTNLQSVVVIKVISPRLMSHEPSRRRFLKEAQTMASVQHPNIATVYHLGDSPQGMFYAMEFCDGPNLHELVRERGRLPVGDALLIARQSASALKALSDRGLIHRDIKPSNIILVRDSQGHPAVKLIDFGLARDVAPDRLDLTQGGFVGTPTYASPEQLLEEEDIDIRSDIYSLGVTLWFLLCGEPPFSGGQFDVMDGHISQVPPWARLPPMSAGVRAILETMLEKSAGARYRGPGLLCAAIDECLEAEGIKAGAFSMELEDATRAASGSVLGDSRFEILDELGKDTLGKLFRGRDLTTGEAVVVRFLSKEISGNTELISKLRRRVGELKLYRHPHVAAILDLESSSQGMRLVRALLEGPTLTDLLKARHQFSFREGVPLLAQLASAFDFLIEKGIGTAQTGLHHIVVVGEEGGEAPDPRRAVDEWEGWSVKVPPLDIQWDAELYSTMGGSQVARRQRSLFTEFVQICYRLLGGVAGSQTTDLSRFVAVRDLGADGNEVFETWLLRAQEPGATGLACGEFLKELGEAEGVAVELPEIDHGEGGQGGGGGEEGGVDLSDAPTVATAGGRVGQASVGGGGWDPGDAMATMVGRGSTQPPPTSSRLGSRAPGSRPSGPPGTRPPGSPGPPGSYPPGVGGAAGSYGGGPRTGAGPGTQGSAAGSRDYSARRIELELQRRMLELEAEHLAQSEELENERAQLWGERERLERQEFALRQQREEIEALERQRMEEVAAERARLEEERGRLDGEQRELEEKRQEQQRIEQENHLRAQMELRKLQEEQRKREQEWTKRIEGFEHEQQAQWEELKLREQRMAEEMRQRELELVKREEEISAEYRQGDADVARQLEAIEAERGALLARQAELEQQISLKDKDLAQAHAELEAATRALEERREAFERERGALEAELERAKVEREREIEEAKREFERRVASLEAEHERHRQELEASYGERRGELERELEVLQGEEAAARMSSEEAQRAREELERRKRELEEERQRGLEEQRQALGQEREALMGQVEELRREAEREVAEARARQEKLEELELELEREREALERQRLVTTEEHRAAAGERERELSEQLEAAARRERELAEQESELAKKREEERAALEAAMAEQRREVERIRGELEERSRSVQAELDDKRREFERQLELERARAKEEYREEARRRSEELRAAEEEQRGRLEQLNREIAEQEVELRKRREKIANAARVVDRDVNEAKLVDAAVMDHLAQREAKMKAEQEELELKLAAFRRAQKKRVVTIMVGVVLLLGLSSVAAFYGWRGDRPEEMWWQQRQPDRLATARAQDWPSFLSWVVETDKAFLEEYGQSEYHQSVVRRQLALDARSALEGLVAESVGSESWGQDLELPRVIDDLEQVSGWDLPPERVVLAARLRLRQARKLLAEGGAGASSGVLAAITAVSGALAALPDSAESLAGEVESLVEALLVQYRTTGGLAEEKELADRLLTLPETMRRAIPKLILLAGELRIKSALESEDYRLAGQFLLDAIAIDTSWAPELRATAERIVETVATLPGDQVQPMREVLSQIGETYSWSRPFVVLGEAARDDQSRFDFFRSAAKYGDVPAKAITGRYYVEFGLANEGTDAEEALEEGLKLVREAAESGEAEALYQLASLHFEGRAVEEDAEMAEKLAERAHAGGHPRALLLVAKSLLVQAEEKGEAALYGRAVERLRAAAAAGSSELPGPYYYLSIALTAEHSEEARDLEGAFEAAREGSQAGDVNCAYRVAVWYLNGIEPVEQNLTLAREFMTRAAEGGHPGAQQWLDDN
jgi:serine/threonine protein kinase